MPRTAHDNAADAICLEAETRGIVGGCHPGFPRVVDARQAPLMCRDVERPNFWSAVWWPSKLRPPPPPTSHPRSFIAVHSCDVSGGCGDDAKARDHDAAVRVDRVATTHPPAFSRAIFPRRCRRRRRCFLTLSLPFPAHTHAPPLVCSVACLIPWHSPSHAVGAHRHVKSHVSLTWPARLNGKGKEKSFEIVSCSRGVRCRGVPPRDFLGITSEPFGRFVRGLPRTSEAGPPNTKKISATPENIEAHGVHPPNFGDATT